MPHDEANDKVPRKSIAMSEKFPLFDEIERLAQSSGKIRFGVGASEEDVQTAQDILGVTFPPSLRNFFLRYGNMDLFSDEIYGLSRGLKAEFYEPECPLIDMVYFSLLERKKYKIDPYWIVLMDAGGYDRYYMDTGEGEEPPVIVISIEEKETVRRYADNFIDFLSKRLKFHLS